MSPSPEQPIGQSQPKNTYVFDQESGVELTRLMVLDQHLTQGMGGVFPEKPNLGRIGRVLDLACGPGGWVLDVAFTYQDMEVVGVDISESMIRYAQARAQAQQRPNASFQVMNVLEPLAFPDNSFDLVNARLISAFVPKTMWPKLFQESLRILRPGGIFRLTELEPGPSNMPAFGQCWQIFNQLLSSLGYNFSPNGQHYGIIHMLPRFFKDAGLQEIGKMAHALDISSGSLFHESFYHNMAAALYGFEALISKTQFISLEEWRDLSQKALAEMQEDDFCALWMWLTVWGQKPS